MPSFKYKNETALKQFFGKFGKKKWLNKTIGKIEQWNTFSATWNSRKDIAFAGLSGKVTHKQFSTYNFIQITFS